MLSTVGTVGVMTGAADAAVGDTTAAPLGGCGWDVVDSPVGNARLFAVDAVDQDDVWAAGHGAANGGPTVLVEHWDGSEWVKADVDVQPHPAGMNDVAALSSTDVWAVGWRSLTIQALPTRPLAEHWDGSSWTTVPTDHPGDTRSDSLVSISAVSADDIWAVGYSLIGASHQTLVEHWDGSNWTVVPSPNPGAHNVLLSVAAISASDAWAVGYRDDDAGATLLIEHWNGQSWSVVKSHNVGKVANVLAEVTAVSPNDVWAVGYKSNGGNNRTLVEHWNGTSWKAVASPNLGKSANMLLDVAFDSPSDGWAVGGTYVSGGDDGYDGLIQHWDGSTWSVVKGPQSPDTSDRLVGATVVPSSNQAWAVGSSQKAGLTEQYCGAGAPHSSGAAVGAQGKPSDGQAALRQGTLAESPRSSTSGGPAESVVAMDMAGSAGVAQSTNTYGAVVDDFNGDGWPDFVYNRHFDPATLYLNNKDGTFSEGAEFGGIWERLSCASADVNQDGLVDLFCALGNDWGTDVHGSELWIQQPNHSFVDEAAEFGVLDPTGRNRRAVFIDANDDGLPDLWIGTKGNRPDGLPSPDRLLINVGGTKFVDAPQYGLDQEVSGGLCGQAFDYNDDGFQDLLTCTDAGLFVYRNEGGDHFTDVTSSLGFMHNAADALMVELNGDGRLDMVGVDARILNVYLQKPDGTFHRAVNRNDLTAVDWVSAGDVDGDGSQDLYVVGKFAGSGNAPDLMLVNDGSGTAFTELPLPDASAGGGDSAYTLDYDHNGLDDMLVLNGAHKEGPLQLIAFFPAEPARGDAAGR
jgi:hypothetical protein